MIKQRNIIRYILCLTILITLASCQDFLLKEMETDSRTAYLDLVNAYQNHLGLKSISTIQDGTKIVFSDGSTLLIASSAMDIEDCRWQRPQTLIKGPLGGWKKNGVDTGKLFVDSGTILKNCKPVYSYYTENSLVVNITNGRALCFYIDKPDLTQFKSFSFQKDINPNLEYDITCSISDGQIKGALPFGCSNLNLVASFVVEGASVSVDGEEQTSGKNLQDYADIVYYKLLLANGDVIMYEAKLNTRPNTLPTIYLTTDGYAEISSRETFVSGTFRAEDPGHYYSDEEVMESRMNIKGRGNTSWGMPKKPYTVHLSESNKVFGIHKDKKWVLIANYSDKSLLRNITAMEISRRLGMMWTPQMRSCELYLNKSYLGVYTLAEFKEVCNHKVDIEPVTPSDNTGDAVTGDYYLEIESTTDRPFHFNTGMGVPIQFAEPEEEVTDQQFAYIKQYFYDFETALKGSNFKDPVNGYAKYIDVDSFIDFYIIQELSKNIDGNLRKSSYMVKFRNGKLKMCNVWDFDIAFGNANYFESDFKKTSTYEGWWIKEYRWYKYLFKDPEFVKKLKARWNYMMPQLNSIPQYIDYNAEIIYEAQKRNFSRWNILGKKVWPNLVNPATYDEEIAYFKKYYTDRLEWLTTNINAL